MVKGAEQVLTKVFQVLDKKYPGRALHVFYFRVFEAKRNIYIRLKPKPKKRRKINYFNSYVPYTISSMKGLKFRNAVFVISKLVEKFNIKALLEEFRP